MLSVVSLINRYEKRSVQETIALVFCRYWFTKFVSFFTSEIVNLSTKSLKAVQSDDANRPRFGIGIDAFSTPSSTLEAPSSWPPRPDLTVLGQTCVAGSVVSFPAGFPSISMGNHLVTPVVTSPRFLRTHCYEKETTGDIYTGSLDPGMCKNKFFRLKSKPNTSLNCSFPTACCNTHEIPNRHRSCSSLWRISSPSVEKGLKSICRLKTCSGNRESIKELHWRCLPIVAIQKNVRNKHWTFHGVVSATHHPFKFICFCCWSSKWRFK